VTHPVVSAAGTVNLQATLSAASACGDGVVAPHHPITCAGELIFTEDEFACPHASVPITEERTRHILQQTVAILVMEMAAAVL
jgi:hypothetical protein